MRDLNMVRKVVPRTNSVVTAIDVVQTLAAIIVISLQYYKI